MRLHLLASFLLASTFLFSQNTNIQQPTSVNTDGAAPDASAILDVQATDRGMLAPRMTTAQRTAIATPATGLLVYDTDTGSFWYYEDSTWNELAPATAPGEGGVNPTGIPIPDNDPSGITSVITLGGMDTVATDTRFRVCLDITHTWTGDLDVSLEAPDGTTIDLSSDNGGFQNYTGTCFTTEATALINFGSPPFRGNWRPEGTFSDFIGKPIAGDWKLKVVDDSDQFNGDGGMLNSWSLKVFRPSSVFTLLADADGDTRVTVEDLPDEDIIRLEAGSGPARLEVRPGSSVFSGPLRVLGNFVSGDESNTASADRTFVGGGVNNTALGDETFVGGGVNNTALGDQTFVGGGANNTASGLHSFVGSGASNTASGANSFIGGGFVNTASGNRSFIGSGQGLTAASYAEAVFGTYNTEYTPNSTIIFDAADRLFVIGNGTNSGARSNAVTVLKSGRVGIGTDSPDRPLTIQGTGISSQLLGMKNSDGDSKWHLNFLGTGLNFAETNVADGRLYLQEGGNIGIGLSNPQHPLHLVSGARCTAAGIWTNASDRRLKTDIANLGYGLREIMALRPVSYRMKQSDEAQIGFIAQEVRELLPELISGTEGEIEEGETLGMSYGNLTAVLVKAVQEQQAEIENLQSQLTEMDELKNCLSTVQAGMARLEAALSPPTEDMGED